MAKNSINLDNIDDEKLLETRISDLPVAIEGTWLQDCIEELYRELEEKGIVFKPECYLADEWLTPEKETCIGIPFYLAHPRLIQLERKFMIDAEGEGKDWCMKLLRHEAGHSLNYAYRLYRRKKWQRLFGPPSQEYKDTYRYRPYSKNYVRHLAGFYAQYHPDEDFVETFAVWLTPGLDWEARYRGWKALEKLRYVDRLMNEIRGKAPSVKSSEKFWRKSTLRYKLKTYYRRKRREGAEDFPDFHDTFLLKFYDKLNENNRDATKLSKVISRHRRAIVNHVARHSGEKKHIIHDLIKGINRRSRELKLMIRDDDITVVLNLTAYVTSLIMNYLHTGRFRGNMGKRKK